MNTAALRTLIIYAVVLPLALFVGWLVAGSMTETTFAMLAAIAFTLLLPVLLKWHYVVMLFSWNTFITIFFLPGKPALWMVMAGITFGIALLNRIMLKRNAFIPAPSVAWPLIILAIVVAVTAKLRGGINVGSFGSSMVGGKGYMHMVAGIIGFFALASQAIPREKARLYVAIFFLSGLLTSVSNIIYFAGPAFYFLFLIFPVSFAIPQAQTDYAGSISRIAGFAFASMPLAFYLFSLAGVRGVLTKWWRLLLLIGIVAIGSLGGYRSLTLQIGMVFTILFIFEGLLRSRIFPIFIIGCVLGACILVPFASSLPHSMQRAISFLPLPIDPNVKADAQGSLEWRIDMWRTMIPDLPKYFWLGKGYSINPTDLYLYGEAMRRGRVRGFEGAIVAGDYHNGPLSVYVPFGIFGCLAFIAFLAGAGRAVYLNYRYGSDELKFVNRLLFAYFLTRAIFFVFLFGALSGDMFIFTGLVGLSIALNHGICRAPAKETHTVRIAPNRAFADASPEPA